MLEMNDINSAKKKVELNKSNNDEKCFSLYLNAIRNYNKFVNDKDDESLKIAANDFYEVLEYRTDRVEPYFYLANIFYFLDNNEKSKEYLDYASNINPDFEHLEKLANLLKDEEGKTHE